MNRNAPVNETAPRRTKAAQQNAGDKSIALTQFPKKAIGKRS